MFPQLAKCENVAHHMGLLRFVSFQERRRRQLHGGGLLAMNAELTWKVPKQRKSHGEALLSVLLLENCPTTRPPQQ